MERKFIQSFLIRTSVLLFFIIAIVVLFDPFYQYHKPLPGLKSVLTDKEYQCVGTLRHFDYDSLIVGSSVCENYNNHWFDDGFACKTIKAIRSYGATADLCFLLEQAFENQDLKYVFYNIDPSSLSADTETTYESSGCPMYLYDKNYLNDISYVLNKSVILEKIPYMLAFSLKSDYDEGNSYNWAQWKYFGADLATGMYDRREDILPMLAKTEHAEKLAGNIALLETQVKSHPETTFKFFFPPYSMLWWDNAYRNGERDYYLYQEEQAIAALLKYENVEIYYYQDEEEIITDLDNYMDMIHFSKEINELICNKLILGEGRLTEENYQERLQNMYELSERIINEDILQYYPK
ncbi:MAG: SGNH/GDSL hydrolase family protein [Lachnospiraceae bacterium]|nr:SGNH/GDSL hydrolase family protein [Lachnospiraceae bacterium]